MEQTERILHAYYKNATVGIDAIESILPKTKHPQLRTELHHQLDYYQQKKTSLTKQMLQQNVKPERQGSAAKFFADMSIKMHAIGGMDTKEIAKLMIEGTNMGIIQLVQTMNQNEEIPSSLKQQGKDHIRKEEAYIERLKPYL